MTPTWYETIYYLLLGATYLLYVLILFKGWNQAPLYLTQTNMFLQTFVGALLIWFFNPFYHYRYHPFHKTIAFTAGIFLLTSTVLTRFMVYIQELIEKNKSQQSRQSKHQTWFEQQLHTLLERTNTIVKSQ